MIKRFKRIKDFGIFSDFAWDATLPEFNKYNLIYGSNGSGKTTLSRLFATLENGSTPSHPEMQYEVDTDSGTLKTGQRLSVPLKVFNREYVEKNVHTLSGRARPILILGEENKKAAEAIEADEVLVRSKETEISRLDKEKAALDKRRADTFTGIARTIKQATLPFAKRDYRKPNAEEDFYALPTKALLHDEMLALRLNELAQTAEADVPEISAALPGQANVPLDEVLSRLHTEATALCAQTVEARVVSRLKEDIELAKWVEQGTVLHKTHESKYCEFCGQPLAEDRMKQLAAHFSDTDRKLKDDINNLLARLDDVESAIRAIQPRDTANLYHELRAPYDAAATDLRCAREALLAVMQTFSEAIQAKAGRTTEAMALDVRPDGTALLAAIEATNAEIKKHNAKTRDFGARKVQVVQEVKTHYLSTIYDEINQFDKQIATISNTINRVTAGNSGSVNDLSIDALKERIASNRAKISSSHKGCDKINMALRTFLGRDELLFDVESDGYVLKRGNVVADALSEGERTAIGVAYFIVNLEEHAFDPNKGIVVVDDPISSLDSNSIFQAFAFLTNAVKDCKQVFFLTHNFDFLRLLLNWMKHSKDRKSYYMITATYENEARVATITELDKLLRDHETEYHYLFKRLRTFKSHGAIESAYDIPNIARKVLETFLMFRIPSGDSIYGKLKKLEPAFEKIKLDAIFKFTNEQSHMTGNGFDPSLVAETEKNVRYLLEMIETVFPEHYQILAQSIQKDGPQGIESGRS